MALSERIVAAKAGKAFAKIVAQRRSELTTTNAASDSPQAFTKFRDSREPWDNFSLYREWTDFKDCW
jgi:antitoxin (DNA-binding transcriptional repressor) of toxin-antitoxin stability system